MSNPDSAPGQPIDITLLQPILAQFGPQGQTALIPVLYAAQEIYGYLPEPVVVLIAKALKVPLAEANGVIEFYSLLYKKPIGKMIIHVCNDPECSMAGSEVLLKKLNRKRGKSSGESAESETLTIERAPCLGLCELAPAMLVEGEALVRTSSRSWRELAQRKGELPRSYVGGSIRILTANFGLDRPFSRASYEAQGGYQALHKALKNMSPAGVIHQIKASGLVGRGGAAFPTGVKWESAAQARSYPKYVVCNASVFPSVNCWRTWQAVCVRGTSSRRPCSAARPVFLPTAPV